MLRVMRAGCFPNAEQLHFPECESAMLNGGNQSFLVSVRIGESD